MKWERIDDYHQRAKVPGGWLVKAHENVIHFTEDRGMESGWDYRISMCFVPDSEYQWEVDDAPN